MEWTERGQFNICFNLVGNGGRISEKVKRGRGKYTMDAINGKVHVLEKVHRYILGKQKYKDNVKIL